MVYTEGPRGAARQASRKKQKEESEWWQTN